MFVYLGQFKNTFLLSCPLYMHMYMFLCFIHGQINDDDDDDDDDVVGPTAALSTTTSVAWCTSLN